MGTAFNMGISQTMTSKSKAKLAHDYLWLYVIPPALTMLLKDALIPSGDDDEEWDMGKLAKRLVSEQISYFMGMMVIAREFAEAGRIVAGEKSFGYTGSAGMRIIADGLKFLAQAQQMEFDDAFRKSAINLAGDATGLPSAQVNRTITGINALSEGETDNPMAILFGFKKQK